MQKCVVITEEGDLFLSPNAQRITRFPGIRTECPEYWSPRDTMELSWSFNAFPQFPYVHKSRRFTGPLFQRLAYTLNTIPLVKDGNFWKLSTPLLDSWRSLETCLTRVAGILVRSSGVALPIDYNGPFVLPSTYKMDFSIFEYQYARKRAIKCRDAFIPLIALCSFGVALHRSAGDVSIDNPRWARTLIDNGVHPEWVNSLKHSIITDFEPGKRVGVIINVETCHWLPQVPAALKANVPVWFHWGKVNNLKPCSHPVSVTYFPTAEDIASATDMRHSMLTRSIHPEPDLWGMPRLIEPWEPSPLPSSSRHPFSQPTEFPSWGEPSSSVPWEPGPQPLPSQASSRPLLPPPPSSQPQLLPASHPPPIEPGSRQRLGELWQPFFARQAAERERRIARESDQQRSARLNREREAQSCATPGRRGAVVYHWAPVNDRGDRVRTRIFRGQVEDFWPNYALSQKKYDGVFNEWDVCTEFDPDAEEEADPLDPDDNFSDYAGEDIGGDHRHDDWRPGDDERAVTPPPPPAYPPKSPPPPPAAHWRDDLVAVYDQDIDSVMVPTKDLAYFLYRRFGFEYSPGPYDQIQPQNHEWDSTRKILSGGDELISVIQRPAVVHFVNRFLETASMHSPSPPSQLWDLSDASPFCLRAHDRANKNILITRREINGHIFYFVEPFGPAESVHWSLALKHAATAVQCYRSTWGPSLINVARHLLELGIPFYTLSLLKAPRNPGYPPHPYVGLGWRPAGYRPDSADYAAYTVARDTFLRTPRARAALLKGGIVWRLATDSLEYTAALDGPSEDVFEFGRYVQNSDGSQLWDDSLSDEELDLICGVYKVYTGQGEQVADMSWWPKYSAWRGSGLDVGYWSSTCEIWYQKRLDAIRNNQAGLRTASQWKDAVKFQRKTPRLVVANERVADMFLNGHHFP